MHRIPIQSIDDPRLDVFRNLKTSKATRRGNLFIAEGTTLVERLLHSSYSVKAVLASEQKLRNFERRIPSGTTVYVLPRDMATELVGYKFHLGVVAAAERKPNPDLKSLLEKPGLLLYGDRLIDPENVGAIIRIGAAFGATGILFGNGSADAFSRRVLRVSMGNGLFLPVFQDVNVDLPGKLKEAGYQLCATVLDPDATQLDSFLFPSRTVLVIGNETHGVSEDVLRLCDHRLTILMDNGTDSLNAAVATGIFCHAYRQQQAV